MPLTVWGQWSEDGVNWHDLRPGDDPILPARARRVRLLTIADEPEARAAT